MLKLIKYEYRKNITMFIIIFGVLFGLEAYLAGSILLKSSTNIAISMVLYMLIGWAGIMGLMIMGVISYARELNAKYSFMTFMTPNSPFKIVGAKYITLFITTVAATLLYGVFVYLDVKLAMVRFEDTADMIETINEVMEFLFGKNISNLIIGFVGMVVGIWVSILLTVSFAYLAITLSNTILANKKGKGWLAFGFFVAIRVVVQVVSNLLPSFDFGNDTLLQIMAGSWPSYIFEIFFIVGTYIGVSALLKHKVSL